MLLSRHRSSGIAELLFKALDRVRVLVASRSRSLLVQSMECCCLAQHQAVGSLFGSAFEHLSTMSGTQVLDSSNPPFYRWFPGPAVTEPLWVWMLPDEGGSEAKQCKAPKGSRFRKYCLELRLVSCGRCSSSSLSFLMVSLGAQLNMCYNAVDRHVEEGDVPAQTIDSIDFCTAPA